MSCSHLNLLLQLVVKGFNHLQSLKEAPLWSNPTLMHRYYNHNSNSCESMAELSADAIVLHGAKFLHTTQVCTQTAAGNETYQESADLADLQSKSGPFCLFPHIIPLHLISKWNELWKNELMCIQVCANLQQQVGCCEMSPFQPKDFLARLVHNSSLAEILIGKMHEAKSMTLDRMADRLQLCEMSILVTHSTVKHKIMRNHK